MDCTPNVMTDSKDTIGDNKGDVANNKVVNNTSSPLTGFSVSEVTTNLKPQNNTTDAVSCCKQNFMGLVKISANKI